MRFLVTGIITAALVLSGCADDEQEPTASGPSAPSAPASPSPSAETGTRLVTHAKGQTAVPATPQRVVVLDSPILDAALFLGVTPVGAVRTAVAEGLPEYLGERAQGIELVGTIASPNLEAIAAQDPDLIISSTLRDDALYDQLSAIAPTVFTEGPGTTWQRDLLVVGEALGQADAARAALEDFEAAADQLGQELGVEGTTASLVRFLPEETRVYGPDSFSGSVLRAVGFASPELDFDEFAIAYLSPEEISQADADVLFATAFGDPDETTRKAVTALWGNLEAIQEGCQLDVADDTWMVGIGLIGAEAILADLERLLGDKDCLRGE